MRVIASACCRASPVTRYADEFDDSALSAQREFRQDRISESRFDQPLDDLGVASGFQPDAQQAKPRAAGNRLISPLLPLVRAQVGEWLIVLAKYLDD
jgi:hypothetical protein